jgi:hypothetical protein
MLQAGLTPIQLQETKEIAMKRRDGIGVVVALLLTAGLAVATELKHSFDAKSFYNNTVQPLVRYGFFAKPEPLEDLTDMPGIMAEADQINSDSRFNRSR